jgi:hypothetical protein
MADSGGGGSDVVTPALLATRDELDRWEVLDRSKARKSNFVWAREASGS